MDVAVWHVLKIFFNDTIGFTHKYNTYNTLWFAGYTYTLDYTCIDLTAGSSTGNENKMLLVCSKF